jgi:hypothetical protein
MPRRKQPETEAVVIPTTAMVASATRYPGAAARIYQPRQDWQSECYRHYSICGEARFAAKFFGHSVSRASLFAAEMVDGTAREATNGPAADALAALFNGKDGQTQMLDALGTHLTVAGEAYLVGRQADEIDTWEIVSCLEMQVAGTSWQINYGNGLPVVQLTEDDVVIRIWLPSPAHRIEADSPFRALLPILSEIEWLTRHVFAQITSRLAGSGVLIMPQGMSFPPPPEQVTTDGTTEPAKPANEADAFMQTLADAMMAPIEDPSSPSAVVPIVITAPDDTIDKPRLLTFWTQLDEASMSLRTEAIRRFALGMDLPPEQILGMSGGAGATGHSSSRGVSHWGAWQVEESTIKLHIEPMLDTIVNALTVGYLRPLVESPMAIVVYDSTALRLRPDRSKEAFELYDRGLISADALRRENGFDEDDTPNSEQFKSWLLIKVASGSATPEQVQSALAALGVVLGGVTGEVTREARPDPTLDRHPIRPRTPDEAELIAAANGLVFRALEKAGNRLRQSVSRPPGAPPYETHLYVKVNGSAERLLEDVWSCAPQVLEGIADPTVVVPVLNSYCISLLKEQSPHRRDRLVNWLRLADQVTA